MREAIVRRAYEVFRADHEPPRLAALTPEQEALITAFLEELAFGDGPPAYQENAVLVLEEWWLPNARYRPHTPPPG